MRLGKRKGELLDGRNDEDVKEGWDEDGRGVSRKGSEGRKNE